MTFFYINLKNNFTYVITYVIIMYKFESDNKQKANVEQLHNLQKIKKTLELRPSKVLEKWFVLIT
ncbi:MAG: hypothetical protein ACRC0G_15545 [Fusobacteriaceae bacterium]